MSARVTDMGSRSVQGRLVARVRITLWSHPPPGSLVRLPRNSRVFRLRLRGTGRHGICLLSWIPV